jgi:hypothetical protein
MLGSLSGTFGLHNLGNSKELDVPSNWHSVKTADIVNNMIPYYEFFFLIALVMC